MGQNRVQKKTLEWLRLKIDKSICGPTKALNVDQLKAWNNSWSQLVTDFSLDQAKERCGMELGEKRLGKTRTEYQYVYIYILCIYILYIYMTSYVTIYDLDNHELRRELRMDL
jgi:hypothetical protein